MGALGAFYQPLGLCQITLLAGPPASGDRLSRSGMRYGPLHARRNSMAHIFRLFHYFDDIGIIVHEYLCSAKLTIYYLTTRAAAGQAALTLYTFDSGSCHCSTEPQAESKSPSRNISRIFLPSWRHASCQARCVYFCNHRSKFFLNNSVIVAEALPVKLGRRWLSSLLIGGRHFSARNRRIWGK